MPPKQPAIEFDADYLDATRATSFFQQVKQRLLDLLQIRLGERIADIGCGTGEDVRALAARVGPRGRVVGVDLSATMIDTARRRLAGSEGWITFAQSDVQRLAFRDATFDAVRAERLLQHVPDADAALREIVRVTKRGGRVVIWEGDLDLFVIDAPDQETSRVMQRFVCDRFWNGAIGRSLHRRFSESRLVNVCSIPLVGQFTDLLLIERAFDLTASVERAIAGSVLERDRATRWLQSLRSAFDAGRFLTAVGGFVVFGRKP